jgi:menaquinone reductase, multiheme cytochrome c subunit
MSNFIFPAWTNNLKELGGLLGAGGGLYATVLIWVGFSPQATDVGYAPEQPVPYSHALHAGQLGLDCRYCHNTAVPPTATCMNCHDKVQKDSEKLTLLRDAHAASLPLGWNRVHDLPDYAYFNHSRHVNSGVSCFSCHGRVDQMEIVRQDQPLSMGWCLDCHRDPAPHIRPRDQVTNPNWLPTDFDKDGDARSVGEKLMKEYGIQPSTDCSTCHR